LASVGQDGLQARLHALVSGAMGPGSSDVPPPGYAPLDPYREYSKEMRLSDHRMITDAFLFSRA
jgi:hypothetical protein